jgi:transcriptional regulator with XRE-family HTH domain
MIENRTLPSGMDLRAAKLAQTAIIKSLNASGLSYEAMAELLGVSGSAIRNYVSLERPPRRDNEILKALHFAVTENKLPGWTENSMTLGYKSQFIESTDSVNSRSILTYNLDSEVSDEEFATLSKILHHIYHSGDFYSLKILQAICGKYYMYRLSTLPGIIVKSYLEINSVGGSNSYIRFLHSHPSRYYRVIENESARETTGVVIKASNALHLIGGTIGGQCANFINLVEPLAGDTAIMKGFNTTLASDRAVMSARVLLIRDPEARPDGICRHSISKMQPDELGFDISMLYNPDSKLIADNSSLITPVRLLEPVSTP